MTQQKTIHVTFSPTQITALRLAWLVLFFMLSAAFIVGIPFRYNEMAEICRVEPCILTLRVTEAEILSGMGLSMPLFAAFHVGVELVVGGIIAAIALIFFWRRFDEPIAVLLAFMLILFGLNFMVESDDAFINHYPQFHPLHTFISSLAAYPFILFLYLFPNGRFVPRWTRFVVPIMVILAVIDPILRRENLTTPSGQSSFLLVYVFLVFVTVGVGVQIYRYRSISTLAHRQQTKWVVLGFTALLVPLLGWTFFIELFPPPPGVPRLLFFTVAYSIMALFLMFFPLSFAIAISRYHLWDIDLLIRRTLVYSVLTGTLLLVYFSSVVLVQTAVNGITGQEQTSQLTIALSTLLIAALFSPLRSRVQAFIDRRFYRRSYNAQQVLARFAASARDQVALEQLTQSIHHSIKEALQPATVSIWLNEDRKSTRNG